MAAPNTEEIKLEYIQAGDYLIPNIAPNEEPEITLTKYGILRKEYLKEEKRWRYGSMLVKGTLFTHCLQIQEQAEHQMEILMDQMAASEGVNEELKAKDQMSWVRKMNNIKARAEEIVLTEIVYA